MAIVTTIAASHLGHFNSLDEIADAKAEIFTGVVPGGIAVINRDTPYFNRLAAAARATGIGRIVSFGKHAEADVRIERAVLHPDCCCITANVMGETLIYKLGLPGEHMAVNSLAVLAAAKLTGADLARAALALATAEPAKGRGVREELATPDGEPAADRRELQRQSGLHARCPGAAGQCQAGQERPPDCGPGRHAGAGNHGTGASCRSGRAGGRGRCRCPICRRAADGESLGQVPSAKRGAYGETSAAITEAVLGGLRVGDVVMVKGSLGSRMGPLAEAMRQKFPPVRKES